MITKKELAIFLSKLKDFEFPDFRLEQYSTPSEIAADLLWNAYMLDDIYAKKVFDPACGPGHFGIGAILLGAKEVIFLDKSRKALTILKENLKTIKGKTTVLEQDILEYSGKSDTVIENPPFGTKEKHADKDFLSTAFNNSNVVYSIHKSSTKRFVKAISKDHGFTISHSWNYNFALPKTQAFHKRERHYIKTTAFRIVKYK